MPFSYLFTVPYSSSRFVMMQISMQLDAFWKSRRLTRLPCVWSLRGTDEIISCDVGGEICIAVQQWGGTRILLNVWKYLQGHVLKSHCNMQITVDALPLSKNQNPMNYNECNRCNVANKRNTSILQWRG